MNRKFQAKAIPSVDREVFLRDPTSIVERVRNEGPIEVTERNGTTRLIICIPTDQRPELY
jgi:hypothetical protein